MPFGSKLGPYFSPWRQRLYGLAEMSRLCWVPASLLTVACSGELSSAESDRDMPDAGVTAERRDSDGQGASASDGKDDDASDDEGAGSAGDDDASDDDSAESASDDDSPDDEASGADDDMDAEEDDLNAPYIAPDTSAVRLTQAEVNNVLRDILLDDTNPGSRFLSEDEFSPFDNDATRQTVSQALVDSLAVLAEDVAARAVTPDIRSLWMPCTPSDAADVACLDQVTEKLARLFFRRALPQSEVEPYRGLLEYAQEAGDFYVAVELLLTSFLQDPEFLYRVERGAPSSIDGALALDDYELAARLSFLLWGSTPDDELLNQAETGTLSDSSTRREAATRLLKDERARAQLYRFHAMWLGYRTLPHAAALNAEFQQETQRLIERVVFAEPQSYMGLFSSPQTYLTPALAAHYSLPLDGGDSGEGWTNYPEESHRAGILSHGSILSAFSKFTDTSPTQRGIFVRDRLLCLDVPPPPATVDVDQPPGDMNARCKLDRYAAHREQSGCADCHALFEPIGVGLEAYDMAGRYREHDDADEECIIDAQGELPGYGSFSGPKQLATLLVENDLITQCMVRHYLSFALAKGQLSDAETRHADALADAMSASDGELATFLVDWVGADSFALRLEMQ